MSKLWIGIIAGVLALAAGAAGTYLYMQNISDSETDKGDRCVSESLTSESATVTVSATGETADWKTYTNDQYGFSFKYPGGWVVANEKSDDNDILTFAKFVDPESGGMLQGSVKDIYVKVYQAKPASLEQWLTEKYKVSGTELETYSVGNTISLGGESGYLSNIGCCGGFNKSYVINRGDYVYMLGSTYEKQQETLELIAPTFQFTK